ncbi:hypothetical protein HYDPIDRAFT_109372, partial [Hydnomerulius pinastri MD-312]
MEPTHRRQALNNYLQRVYGHTRHLTWGTGSQGPHHQPTWLAIAYIAEIEYGRGTGLSIGDAKEAAAGMALSALQ